MNILIEAEDMVLSSTYQIETGGFASGGQLISLFNRVNVPGKKGVASYTFSGEPGAYALTVGYYDEDDGVSTLAVFVDGLEIDSWALDELTTDGVASSNNFRTRTIDGLTLDVGSVIELRGTASDPIGEWSRVDYIEFAPNSAPTAVNGTLAAALEDIEPAGATLDSLFGSGFSDSDLNASLSGVAVVGNLADGVAEGEWQYSTDGREWFAIGTVDDAGNGLALSAGTWVRFLPATDYNGTPPALTLRVMDNAYAGAFTAGSTRQSVDTTQNGDLTAIAAITNTLSTNIIAVNDAPSFAMDSDLNVDEDAGEQTLPGWATAISPGADDETEQLLNFSLTNDNPDLFTVAPSLSPEGTLTYTLANNAKGSANVTVTLVDDGGADNRGVDTSVPQVFTITVNPVADVPDLEVEDASGEEDSTLPLSINAALTDPSEDLTIEIEGVPAEATLSAGQLQNDGRWVLTPADLNDLRLILGADEDSSFTLTVTAIATDGDDSAETTQSLDVTVQAVNDAPRLVQNQTVNLAEGASVNITSTLLAVADVDTAAVDLVYALTELPDQGELLLANTPLALNDTFTQDDLNNNRLIYRHDGSETTSDSFSFSLQDDSEVAPGADAIPGTVNITIEPVNDPPSLTDQVTTLNENSPAGTVVSTLVASDPEVADTLTYAITAGNDGGAFVLDSETGVLTVAKSLPLNYEATPRFDLTVTVTDSGNPELTDTAQVTVALKDVNDQNQWNGDAFSDIAWYNPISGRTSLWYMENRQFKSMDLTLPQLLVPNTAWQAIGVGDVDGDGADDLTWHNPNTGEISLWYMDGSQIKNVQPVNVKGGSNWSPALVADFDNDGKQDDFWWRNRMTGEYSIWLTENGKYVGAIKPEAPLVSPGAGGEIVGIGDFDSDRKRDDILWRFTDPANPNTAQTLVWLMEGTQRQQVVSLSQDMMSANWHLYGAADYDGDGLSNDILWHNANLSQVAIWNLEGTSVQSQGTTTLNPSQGWIPIA